MSSAEQSLTSINTIVDQHNFTANSNDDNSVLIDNDRSATSNTDKNGAGYSDGAVSFFSGNDIGSIAVQSDFINVSHNRKEHTKPKTPSPTAPTPANNSIPAPYSSSSVSTSTGSTLGNPVMVTSIHTLSVMGGSYWFFIASIGNILMMLFGWYLRLRSGRSPGFAFAS